MPFKMGNQNRSQIEQDAARAELVATGTLVNGGRELFCWLSCCFVVQSPCEMILAVGKGRPITATKPLQRGRDAGQGWVLA